MPTGRPPPADSQPLLEPAAARSETPSAPPPQKPTLPLPKRCSTSTTSAASPARPEKGPAAMPGSPANSAASRGKLAGPGHHRCSHPVPAPRPCHVTRRASFSLTAHLPPSRHTPLHSLSAPHAPPSLPPPRLRALSLRSKRMSAERVSMVPEDADHAKNWALRKLQDAVRALIFRKVRLPRPLRPPLRCPRRTPISRLAPPPHPGHSPCRPPRPAPPPPTLVLPCSPPPSSLHHHR